MSKGGLKETKDAPGGDEGQGDLKGLLKGLCCF